MPTQHCLTTPIQKTAQCTLSFIFSHPYADEISQLEYPLFLFEETEPCFILPLQETPLVTVDSEHQLDALIIDLEKENSIAVDLENHSYRSFQGFCCLIQISTIEKDFIIDALRLRSSLSKLNQIFCNPKILKVFHGAESDILWLQRDFGVYVVGMFDTFRASVALEMAGNSLSHILNHYCDVKLDKKYQLADWRIRPLPDDMLQYAREDTHYLLHVFHKMKNELLGRTGSLNLVQFVLSKSAQTCLQVYKKDTFDEANGWIKLYQKYDIKLDSSQVLSNLTTSCVFLRKYTSGETIQHERKTSLCIS
jgi:exosome complex exonuclease RRP6